MVVQEIWTNGVVTHRAPANGPAITYRNAKTNAVMEEVFLWNGLCHRPDGPAHRKLNVQGTVVILERYVANDIYHRNDGPALILRMRKPERPSMRNIGSTEISSVPYRRVLAKDQLVFK